MENAMPGSGLDTAHWSRSRRSRTEDFDHREVAAQFLLVSKLRCGRRQSQLMLDLTQSSELLTQDGGVILARETLGDSSQRGLSLRIIFGHFFRHLVCSQIFSDDRKDGSYEGDKKWNRNCQPLQKSQNRRAVIHLIPGCPCTYARTPRAFCISAPCSPALDTSHPKRRIAPYHWYRHICSLSGR